MRINDDQRVKLNGSMVRSQDSALVLHNVEEGKKAANSAYLPNFSEQETMVAAMFSAAVPIGDIAIRGIIAAASLSTSVLLYMVQLPFNVPYWFFYRPILPIFLRLSCKYTVQIYSSYIMEHAALSSILAFHLSRLALNSLAEQQLTALAGLLQRPSGRNQAPHAVTKPFFKSQVLPDASLRTLMSMNYAVFCSTPNKSLPVRVFVCWLCSCKKTPAPLPQLLFLICL